MNTLFTIWAVISLFIMPIVYLVLSIKIKKALERKSNCDTDKELLNKIKQLHNGVAKTYESIDEQKITLDYICQLLGNIDNIQRCLDEQNNTLEAICQTLRSIESKQDNSVMQEQINKAIENINLQQNSNNGRDYVQLYNLLASIKAENKDIFNIITKIKTEKALKNQLHDALYQNEVLLDDIDVLERKYEKQQYDFNGLLEAAKILCEYYEENKDINNNLPKNNTVKKETTTIKETEQDEAMKRLNELIKKLYKIKEEQ